MKKKILFGIFCSLCLNLFSQTFIDGAGSLGARTNVGYGGDGGANLEFYSKTHPTRMGEFRFVFGGGDFGSARWIHYDGNQWITKMILDKNGNLGIGTLSPSEKMTVNGKILAEEVKIVGDITMPDYVFAENYKLIPLDELRSFIDKNKHLPNIPSAKEFEKTGINLGDMNRLLLEKIEELTLYILQLENRLKEIEE